MDMFDSNGRSAQPRSKFFVWLDRVTIAGFFIYLIGSILYRGCVEVPPDAPPEPVPASATP